MFCYYWCSRTDFTWFHKFNHWVAARTGLESTWHRVWGDYHLSCSKRLHAPQTVVDEITGVSYPAWVKNAFECIQVTCICSPARVPADLIMSHCKLKQIWHNIEDKIKLRIVWWVKIWSLDERTAVCSLRQGTEHKLFFVTFSNHQ